MMAYQVILIIVLLLFCIIWWRIGKAADRLQGRIPPCKGCEVQSCEKCPYWGLPYESEEGPYER